MREQRRNAAKKAKWRINYIGLVTRCIIVLLIAGGIFWGIRLMSPKPSQAVSERLETKVLETEQTSIKPIAAVTQDQPSPTPSETFEKKEAEGLLVIVNWDNPVSSKRPENLVTLDSVFGSEVKLTNGEGSIHLEAAQAAREMFLAAQEEGIGPYLISSAYRSVDYQTGLFEKRLEQDPNYGEDPYDNPVKVMPGNMSEHATGLAIDILSVEHETANDEYGETPEGKWMRENAHRFGFILRYPQDKEHITGVIYEPWHFRYVGKEAAQEMYELGLCLEEYVQS